MSDLGEKPFPALDGQTRERAVLASVPIAAFNRIGERTVLESC
jgi:hypothetical protein